MKKNKVLDSESFSKLFGEAQPIKRKPNIVNFNAVKKTPTQLKKEAQLLRKKPQNLHQNINENFSGLNEEALSPLYKKRFNYDQTIDLHGLYVDDAVMIMKDKLNFRSNRKIAYWLIIHGKGKNSAEFEKAPLKQAIIELLYQHPAVAAMKSIHDYSLESGAIAIALHRCL